MSLGSLVADFTTRRPFASAAAGLTLLGGLIAIDSVVFQVAFDLAYVRWYVENGALLSLTVALVTVGWPDLNDLRNLVSAHPLRYLQAWVGLFGFTFVSMPDADVSLRRLHGTPGSEPTNAAWDLLDIGETLLRLAWLGAMLTAILGWLLVIAPLQYFAFLVSGALVRGTFQSSQKTIVRAFKPGVGYDFVTQPWSADEPPPDGWKESGFVSRPFALTSVLAAGLLFGLSFLV